MQLDAWLQFMLLSYGSTAGNESQRQMAIRVRSYSKINLGLAIGLPRPDGFHHLATVYQTLELHDLVTVTAVTAARTTITLTTNDTRVPLDDRNTAWRMVSAALNYLSAQAEVHIHIEKRLPVQGGLGAGSANAAAALIGLERELGQRPPDEVRQKMAAQIGSDVPLFLIGGTVMGVGRGEQVSALPDVPATWCVVAVPAVGVSTSQAFRDWDARHVAAARQLTSDAASDRLDELSRSTAAVLGKPRSSGVSALGGDLAEDPLLALVRTGIENDFEEVVFPQYPYLGNIKRILAGTSSQEAPLDRAVYAALSGSGSALFGLYQTEAAARKAHHRVSEQGIAALLTKTMPREGYWREMLVQD